MGPVISHMNHSKQISSRAEIARLETSAAKFLENEKLKRLRKKAARILQEIAEEEQKEINEITRGLGSL